MWSTEIGGVCLEGSMVSVAVRSQLHRYEIIATNRDKLTVLTFSVDVMMSAIASDLILCHPLCVLLWFVNSRLDIWRFILFHFIYGTN